MTRIEDTRYRNQDAEYGGIIASLPIDSIHIAISSGKIVEGPFTKHLAAKYSGSALETLSRHGRIKRVDGDMNLVDLMNHPTRAFGVDVTNFSQVLGVIQALRKRVSGSIRIKGADIIVVGSFEGLNEYAQAIDPDPKIIAQNQQFIEELGEYIQSIKSVQAKKTWKQALIHFQRNSYKTDCGISTISTVQEFKSIGQKFGTKSEILNWVHRLKDE